MDLLKEALEKSHNTINEQSNVLTEMNRVNFVRRQENNQCEMQREVIRDIEEQLIAEKNRGERSLNEIKKRNVDQSELLSA